MTNVVWNLAAKELMQLKCLCAHYPFNQILKFEQTNIEYIITMGERSDWIFVTLTFFWRSLNYEVCKNEPCVFSISRISTWYSKERLGGMLLLGCSFLCFGKGCGLCGKGCGLWLWHSLDFSLTFFFFIPLFHTLCTELRAWNLEDLSLPRNTWIG